MVSKDELRRAKDFLTAQAEMALDDPMEHMLWMGESLLNLGYLQTKEEMRHMIEKVSTADIMRLAGQIIRFDKLVFAAVGPQDHQAEGHIKKLLDTYF